MPVSDTISCVVVSVLDHVSLAPAVTDAGFGVNAATPNVLAAGAKRFYGLQ